MVSLYDIPKEQLVPERRNRGDNARDAANGTIRLGSVIFATHEADDDSLRAFLAAVRQERGLAPDAPVAVRASDAEVLAELLGGSAEAIVRNLQRLLGVDEREAAELSRWMFRRTAVAGAMAVGLAAGVLGAGAFSSPSAAVAAEITAPSDAPAPAVSDPADPNWAVIGDAAVLWRDGVPHD
jgi:hypothetical protein